MPSIPCPLCEASHHRVISRFAGAYNVRARIVICKECGFLFRRDPWGDEQVAEIAVQLRTQPTRILREGWVESAQHLSLRQASRD